MAKTSRRQFLRLAGAAGSMLPGLIDRAMAIPARAATGSIRDVEHIVVCMQENRSFDHYFGLLNGVRGFGDPRPLRLAGGRSVWAQPSKQHADGYVLPFHGDSKTTRSFKVDGAEQSHQENLHIFNRGRYDQWGHSGELHNRMLHYAAGDLPFYYALADAFTICDAYHCSTMTQTQPNRLHLFTGCNGGGGVDGEPEMSNYGEDDTPWADMGQDRKLHRHDAFRWTTYAERLQAAAVSWKVYQEYDNFGDNTMSFFPAFRSCSKDSDLYRRCRSWVSESKPEPDRTRSDGEQLVEAFRNDIAAGRLPQISWIVTAADLSEHPKAVPAKGEHLTARLIEALVDHPQVFARTVFILNYDEAGGFYDHMPQPVPPVGDYLGRSTVSLAGELKDYAGDNVLEPGKHPIGLGVRTPTIIVSPWSRGGFVCSELFDHTSIIRFMERCFGVHEPNISAWRRSVCGDLTSAFDFTASMHARRSGHRKLPSTNDFLERVARSEAGVANSIPQTQSPTAQMPGQRPHRPLPYDLDVIAKVTPERRLRIEMINHGRAGAVITVHDNTDAQEPWHYTIGAGDRLGSEQWHDEGSLSAYDLTLRGPNGLWRRYAGPLTPVAEVRLVPHPDSGSAELILRNEGNAPAVFTIALDEHYPTDGSRTRTMRVDAGAEAHSLWSLVESDHWFDFLITTDSERAFVRRFAGKIETGKPGRTDPGIGPMRITV